MFGHRKNCVYLSSRQHCIGNNRLQISLQFLIQTSDGFQCSNGRIRSSYLHQSPLPLLPSLSSSSANSNPLFMAPVQSKCSLSGHQSIVDDQLISTIRKEYNRPVSSSPNSKPHHPTINLNLTPSQTARINQEFRHVLIACVIGKNIHHENLTFRLRCHLPLTGDLNVSPLGLGFFALIFSNPSDYSEALKERPWLIPQLCIHVFPWIPNFKPSKAFISFVDVWVRLPELGMEHYNREMFENIAKAIGVRLVKIDPVTERKQKYVFARICITITLSNPLIHYIHIEGSRQNIVYEGLDSLCSVCGCVDDLKHICLNQNNPYDEYDPHQQHPCPLQAFDPSSSSGLDYLCSVCGFVYDLKHDRLNKNSPSGSSGHDPHQQNPFPCQPIDFSSSSGLGLDSKKPLIHSLPSLESALRSKSQEKDPFPELNLKDYPKLKMVKVVENEKKTLPNFPRESSTTTMKTTESVPLAVSLVEDQFRAAKASCPTKLALHNNGSRSSSAVEAGLNLFSTVSQQLTTVKEMINTPFGVVNFVDSWPTVYTIDPTTMSLEIEFSEVPTTTGSNQTQYAINFVLNPGRENENEVDSKAASMPSLCSKKMLCWNFDGKDIALLKKALKDLIGLHEPSIVLIFGSKISSSDADEVMRELGFDGFYSRKPDGYNGGVWMMLSRQDVQTEVNSQSSQKVFASVHFHCKLNEPELWGNTFFYASTRLMDIMMAYCGEKVNKH
ncbi:hypothetical protein E6C27_scaffold65G00460 [Cucumis melo var. makuwa]|uniref:DUF4283 domain-containing protein n=2 Tax=Cucumis melo TaxID=3656 RepID=A0A5A7SSW6_CUCMM|nr:hypothetical protein E6C27_scaffold65G00460 [Cucumis melo var. makuwa]